MQSMTVEQLSYFSANFKYGSYVDVVEEGFWNRRQKTYF